MESAKPSSSAPPYPGGAGAGGKFRKPPVSRKRPSTPYDRPPVTTANDKPDESQDSGGGWLSKLVVNPARRLIVGGATRILPSFFSKSDSSSADEYEDDPPDDRDDQDIDETGNEYTDAKDTLELGVSRSSGDAGPSNAMDKLKGILDHNIVPQDESKNSPGGLSTIENMLKGKQFSRDERNRLMEILNSRLVDTSSTEKTPKENLVNHENPSRLTIGKQYDVERAVLETPMPRLQSNIQEVTASPIDIARAYMGNRTSEKFSYSIKSKDEITHQNNELISSKPHFLTPSSKPSTCWPGAMVQEPRGYLTPQIQRTRYGLHNFPKTPYSRTIYSTTKPKMSQLQSDNNKPSNVPLTTFQQSRTPIYSTMKSSGDDGGYGSVGPIRRVRNKFSSEPQSVGRTPSRSFVPVFQKNPEASVNKHEQSFKYEAMKTHGATSSGTSSETVRKIMEQLDRHKPTPKEKQEELKLATEWKKLPSQDNNNNNYPLPKTDNTSLVKSGGVSFKETEPIKSVHVANNASAGPSFNFANTIVTAEKSKSQPWSMNGQEVTKKRQSQPILKPITFTRPDPQQVSGFTFPFSATASSASEPPTPSIMPTFPATGGPPPAYTFGMKKSERLVFSFPSTSSGSHVNDSESDLKFDFGSDKKRVSFASIGKDAIAIN